ncbi:MAG: hypothetical protein M1838_003290 [Thelocarpon superellum]|nr:MAG: hypothetical protein M1838_003290 [Thelocarpon superellum]
MILRDPPRSYDGGRGRRWILILLMFGWAVLSFAAVPRCDDTATERDNRSPDRWQQPLGLTPSDDDTNSTTSSPLPMDSIPALLDALEVMESEFFEVWQGVWPESIDWTGAVLGTYVSAALMTLSSAASYTVPQSPQSPTTNLNNEALAIENLVNRYFTQVMGYYHGQDAFGLRNEAYDDMLWVVLGWLESIKFIKMHSSRHYPTKYTGTTEYDSYAWYGAQFIPALAHRARIFYDIASQGWDTSLCGGGMVWNPYLRPYKNAITNELFITASVSMYLSFPGDSIAAPFMESSAVPPAKAHDPKYLAAALEAYKWLSTSNMTNAAGLFVDGYHVRRRNGTHNTQCDDRNEMVYTYNQGVLLSGLRGLWESTGARSFLDEGHALIRAVIKSTGFRDDTDESRRDQWAGLGRNGVLEEYCDARGRCSQDAQTFKGIFFHHLSLFCTALPDIPRTPNRTYAASPDTARFHAAECMSYQAWITHNAHAAYMTRNTEGKYGMWWGQHASRQEAEDAPGGDIPEGAVDYRNQEDAAAAGTGLSSRGSSAASSDRAGKGGDVNDRGRGRTVETQGGGLAVLRAYHEIGQFSS